MKATYRDVCSHNICHAEAVQVEFDPNEVSYEDLVDVFWSIHNPTTKNRQGWDICSQALIDSAIRFCYYIVKSLSLFPIELVFFLLNFLRIKLKYSLFAWLQSDKFAVLLS